MHSRPESEPSRTPHSRVRRALAVCALGLLPAWSAPATANPPAFDFQDVMDTYFDDTSGLIAFRDYAVAFAPPDAFNGFVAVLDAGGDVVGRHTFSERYVVSEGVYAKVRASGPADVQLTEPGLYTLVFVVNDQPVTRMPVRLRQTSAGDDPFKPQKTFAFDGYWRTVAHITQARYRDQAVPEFTVWLGGLDLGDASRRDGFVAELLRDGNVVAHSKRRGGVIKAGHFQQARFKLFEPHVDRDAGGAAMLTMAQLRRDGEHELRVRRTSDNKAIRSYDFTVADGRIRRLDRAALGYQPIADRMLPKVQKQGAGNFADRVEAIWIQDGG